VVVSSHVTLKRDMVISGDRRRESGEMWAQARVEKKGGKWSELFYRLRRGQVLSDSQTVHPNGSEQVVATEPQNEASRGRGSVERVVSIGMGALGGGEEKLSDRGRKRAGERYNKGGRIRGWEWWIKKRGVRRCRRKHRRDGAEEWGGVYEEEGGTKEWGSMGG